MGILLLALAVRVAALERQPLWWDEGNSVYFAHQSPLTLLHETRLTRDTDPPVYRLSLSGWVRLAGSTPLALRLYSVYFSLIVVALTWTVGRWLASREAALVATLLVALSPMQIFYAREAKGYAFATVCALLSVYAWGKELGYLEGKPTPGRSGWWAVYVLSTAAAIGTHYYLGALLLWQGLWTMGKSLRPAKDKGGVAVATLAGQKAGKRRKSLACGAGTRTFVGRWLLAAGVILLLLVPWTLAVLSSTVQGVGGLAYAGVLSLPTYLARVALELAAGPEQTGPVAWLAVATLGLLACYGALRHRYGLWLLTWLAAPLAASFGVQAIYPFFFPRFLLYLGPPLALLVAAGWVALGRRSRTVAALALVGSIALLLPGVRYVYTAPVDEMEDPRPVVARLRERSQPGDALLYIYIWQLGYLQSYWPGQQLAAHRAYVTDANVGIEMAALLADHEQLWLWDYLTTAEDPGNQSASWLNAEAYQIESRAYGAHALSLYLAPDYRTPGVGPAERETEFRDPQSGARVSLRYPEVEARLSPGEALALPLRWRALTSLDEDYRVFCHVGLPAAPPLAQNDGIPVNGLSPTFRWTPGEDVLDRRALLLPQMLPPGRYAVTVGLYRATDNVRLVLLEGGDELLLGELLVER